MERTNLIYQRRKVLVARKEREIIAIEAEVG